MTFRPAARCSGPDESVPAGEPHRGEALDIVASTEVAVADALASGSARTGAAVRARVVSAVMYLTMAASEDAALTTDQLLDDPRPDPDRRA